MRCDPRPCRACTLGSSGLPRCVGVGPDDAEVVVVGINPSRRAVDGVEGCFLLPLLAETRRRGGEPVLLTGSTRAFLELADRSGLDLGRCYATNALKCATPGNRAPTPMELETCAERYLRRELLELPNLRTVLVLGRAAGVALGLSDFGLRRTVEGTTAEATLLRHPNATLRKWTRLETEAENWRRALLPRGRGSEPARP